MYRKKDYICTKYDAMETINTEMSGYPIGQQDFKQLRENSAKYQTKGNGQFENSVIAAGGGIVTALFVTPQIPQFLPQI